MQTDCFKLPTWYEALALAERASLFQAGATSGIDMPAGMDADLAERRFKRWRAQAPFCDEAVLSERLSADGLTPEQFRRLLGESPDQLQSRLPESPDWLREIERVYTDWASLPGNEQQPGVAGFDTIARPLIDRGCERLRRGIESLAASFPNAPIHPEETGRLFLANLPTSLSQIVFRTMVLELNVARVEGRLTGETGEERFKSFVSQLGNPESTLNLLQEYPVLARQLLVCIDHWVATSLEFLERLCSDWENVRRIFSPDRDPGLLSAVKASAGDTHRRGRSVAIASFSSGFRLVYKPHSLAVDKHFFELQNWLNSRGSRLFFRTIRVLHRGDYGWTEFVPVEPCKSNEEVSRFYERLGAHLALLYTLDATDVHYENLIASGEHPVLVDLEALFHPRLRISQNSEALEFSRRILEESVMRISLLPQQIWFNDEGEGIDISGMGGGEGQTTPFPVVAAENGGTDEMRLVKKRVPVPTSNNRPTIEDVKMSPEAFREEIVRGFKEMYRLLLASRGDLLAPGGPISWFANDEVRLVARPSRVYAQILNQSYHPNVLRCALDRDRLLDKLWVGTDERPELAPLIPHEHEDLRHGDIPVFATRPSSIDLWSSTGTRIRNVLDEPSLDHVRKNFRRLGDPDLRRQLWFIESSLAAASQSGGSRPTSRSDRTDEMRYEPAPAEKLIEAAQSIGERLESTAYIERDFVMWTGLLPVQEKSWFITPLGDDLYSGLPGIALFLAYLGDIAGQPRYTELARMALMTSLKQFDESSKSILRLAHPVGAFSGEAGLLYVLALLSQLWNDPPLLDCASQLVSVLNDRIERDQRFDLMHGASGYICALEVLHQCSGSPLVMEGAIRCGNHLLNNAQTMSQGIAWDTLPGDSKAPPSGFSHGASGIAHALLRLSRLTGVSTYREAAVEAFAYERSLFAPGEKNWADVRVRANSNDDHPRYAVAWCHGAPGIGLARLHAGGILDDSRLHYEADMALQRVLECGPAGTACLCHGDLGNIELLIEGARSRRDEHYLDTARRRAAEVLVSAEKHGWRCGGPKPWVEIPGFMIGLAGIGYGLLRLASPDATPSVLTLAGPGKVVRTHVKNG